MDISKRVARWVLTLILLLQIGCLVVHAYRSSPVSDEFGHFYAGIVFWKYDDRSLFNVNPPLVRALGTMLASQSRIADEVAYIAPSPPRRPEFEAGRKLFKSQPQLFQKLLFSGRLLVSIFCVVGTVVCYFWGCRLGNQLGGISAAAFWAFQPETLSHGSLITNDIPVAVSMFLALYLFSRWLLDLSWKYLIACAIAFSLALLCKFTALILLPLFLIFGLAIDRTFYRRRVVHAFAFAVIVWAVVGAMYGFVGIGKRLDSFPFVSVALTLDTSTPSQLTNRFVGTTLGMLPSPLPEHFVLGLDRQQLDFDLGLTSYAAGKHTSRGWWWFYMYSMLVKLPLGTLFAIAVMFVFVVQNSRLLNREIMLILCAIILMLEVTGFKDGIGQQHRYIFPLYPFVFVLFAVPFRQTQTRSVVPYCIFAGSISTIVAAAMVAPFWLSSINSLAGGSKNGFHHLFNDATDWGQSAYDVVRWIKLHPKSRPLKLKCTVNTDCIPIDAYCFAGNLSDLNESIDTEYNWLIISQSDLSQLDGLSIECRATEPVDVIANTHFVYRIPKKNQRFRSAMSVLD